MMSEGGSTEELCDTFQLTFSRHCLPFKLPTYPAIAAIAKKHFKDDAMNVDWRDHYGDRLYIMELTKKVKRQQEITLTVNEKVVTIALEPIERGQKNYRGKREKGVLLTFKDAGKRFMSHIPNTEIDRILQNELEMVILKPTELQRIPETDVFNGNRYAVIRTPTDITRIPDSMPVRDPATGKDYQIRISYSGKKWYCPKCMDKHEGGCPALKAFYAAKDTRKKMEEDGKIETKIMSDSTMRNTEKTGLQSDVLRMSGGGIGQVAQAAINDPDATNKNLVIVAGANDIKNKSFATPKEYTQSVTKAIEKIMHIAEENPERTIILPQMIPIDETKTLVDDNKSAARRAYLHSKTNRLVEEGRARNPPVENIFTKQIVYEVDITGHPTIAGTANILKKINEMKELNPELIWNPEYITNERIYRGGIQSIFVYGCGICQNYGQDAAR